MMIKSKLYSHDSLTRELIGKFVAIKVLGGIDTFSDYYPIRGIVKEVGQHDILIQIDGRSHNMIIPKGVILVMVVRNDE